MLQQVRHRYTSLTSQIVKGHFFPLQLFFGMKGGVKTKIQVCRDAHQRLQDISMIRYLLYRTQGVIK